MSGYERTKRLAKELGCTIPELLVLARQNDPFFVGSKTDLAMAEWFADLWLRFGYTTGVHLRRVHYQLVSQEAATKHNGKSHTKTQRVVGPPCVTLASTHGVWVWWTRRPSLIGGIQAPGFT